MRFTLVVLGLFTLSAYGQPQAKPQHERMLPPDVLKKAKELEEKIQQQTNLRDMVALGEELLALRKKHQGADHWEVRDVQNLLDDFKLPLLTPAQVAKREEALKLNREAVALIEDGKAREAFPLTTKTLTLLKEIFGPDHHWMAAAYNNVAAMYHSQGRYPEALALSLDSSRIQQKKLGENHPIYAQGLTNVGLLYEAMDKHDEAEKPLRESLRIHLDVYGTKHRDTARSMGALAHLVEAQGRYRDAEKLYVDALTIYKDVRGIKHADTADAMRDLAGVYQEQRRYTEARELLIEALAISTAVRREEHPRTASIIQRLGLVYKSMQQDAKAEVLFQQAYAIRQKTVGADHPETVQSRAALAALYHEQGKYALAAQLAYANLHQHMKVLGEWHVETATSLQNLAQIYHSQGKYTEAEPLFQQALRIYQGTDQTRRKIAFTLNNIGELYYAMRKYEQAEKAFREGLAIRQQVLSDKHPQLAVSLNSLAGLLLTLRRYEEAEKWYQQAHQMNIAVHGKNDQNTAATSNNLALLKVNQQKYAEAEKMFSESLTTLQTIFGEYHPKAVDTTNNLALTCFVQGKLDQAMTYAEQSTRGYEASRTVRAGVLERSVANSTNPYPLRSIIAVKQGRATEAFQWLEYDFARGLLDAQSTNAQPLTKDEQQQHTQWTERLHQIQSHIARLSVQAKPSPAETKELESLIQERRKIDEQLATMAGTVSQRQVADVATIQRALDEESAFLTWVDLSLVNTPIREYWAVVVRSTGAPQWVRLLGRGPDGEWTAADKELTREIQTTLSTDNGQDLDRLIKQLHEQRMAPLVNHLKGVKKLYVTAVRDMAGIPIETIAPDHAICYVPSGTYLARRTKPSEQPVRMLALGDPVFNEDLAKVRQTLPPSGLLVTYVLPGGAASEARLKANDALLTYAGVKLESDEQLAKLIAQNADEKNVTITFWREVDGQTVEREVPVGRMGVIVAKDPAKTALASRRALAKQLTAVTRGEVWEELPGTLAEVRQLESLLGKDRITTLLRGEASEHQLERLRTTGELAQFRYLHLATHGQANAVRPFASTLILAQERSKETTALAGRPLLDNELSAAEVLEFWKLKADLVTLSACETALGQQGGGDGLLGFAQAFLLAGSRSVCLSLWKVDDTATALLMDRFYRNLLGQRTDGAKPMTKMAALDEAKRWLRNLSLDDAEKHLGTLTKGLERGSKKGREVVGTLPVKGTKPFAHPRYWAAFILVGSPE